MKSLVQISSDFQVLVSRESTDKKDGEISSLRANYLHVLSKSQLNASNRIVSPSMLTE